MGDGAIFVYWGGQTPLEEISLPATRSGIGDWQVEAYTAAALASRWTGAVHVQVGGKWDNLTLVVNNVSRDAEPELYRALAALEEHLKAGYPIGVCLDRAKAWAALPVSAALGDTSIYHSGNYWSSYTGGTATLAVGDEVVLRSFGDGGWREVLEGGVLLSGSLPLASGERVRFDHLNAAGGQYLRHRGFYPLVRLAESEWGRPLLTEDHGRNFSFVAKLYEDASALAVLATQEGQQLGAEGSQQGMSLSRLIQRAEQVVVGSDPIGSRIQNPVTRWS